MSAHYSAIQTYFSLFSSFLVVRFLQDGCLHTHGSDNQKKKKKSDLSSHLTGDTSLPNPRFYDIVISACTQSDETLLLTKTIHETK
jgi:hypothetical protein